MTKNDFKGTSLEKNRFWSNNRYFAIGKWIILFVMLYFVIRFVNLPDVFANFKKISLSTLISFFILILTSKFLYAFRWYMICANGIDLRNISILFLLRINLLGEFIGIAMPSSLGGEAVRVVKLNDHTGAVAKSTVAIMADRLIGLISMGLVALALLPKFGISVTQWLPWSVDISLSVMVLSAFGFVIAIFFLHQSGIRIPLPRAIQNLELSFSLLTTLLLLSGCGHLLFASGYYLLFQEIHPVPFLVSTALIFTAQLARIVPISLLGIGLGEASIVSLASLVGIKPEETFVVVVVALGALYFYAICGLLIELVCDGKAFFHTIIGYTPESLEGSQ